MPAPQQRDVFLFPLGTVLFPEGVLPLKIFEQRYLEMTKVCLRDGLPFGVVLIREGGEVGAPALPQAVGCLANIAEWDMPQLGLFHLIARGGERFRVLDTRAAPSGLLSGTVEMLPADPPAAVDPVCRGVLATIIERAGAAYFPSPVRLDDASWVGYRLAEILPLAPRVRQQLLELGDAAERCARLRVVLVEHGLVAR
jgi:Lon protease-like protein